MWHEHLMTFDFYSNPVDHTRFLGRWEKPSIITRFSIQTSIRSDIGELKANEMPPEVNGSEVIYDFEFTSLKNQLQEQYNKKIITDDTKFYYWANDGVKYSVRSFDEFLNCSGDDLVLLGRSASKLSGVFKGEERVAMLESLRAQIKEEMKESGFFNKK